MPDDLKDASAAVMMRLQIAINAATEQAAADLTERLRAGLLGPRSGQMYGDHRASAPGESPAHWTGQLSEAVSVRQLRGEGGRFASGWEVYVDPLKAPYAYDYLEYGSPGGKIAPRPWFWPTVEEFQGEFVALVAAAVTQGLRGMR